MRSLKAFISFSTCGSRRIADGVRIMSWGPLRWTAGATLLHNLPLFAFISCEASSPATLAQNAVDDRAAVFLGHGLGHDLAPPALLLAQTRTRYLTSCSAAPDTWSWSLTESPELLVVSSSVTSNTRRRTSSAGTLLVLMIQTQYATNRTNFLQTTTKGFQIYICG